MEYVLKYCVAKIICLNILYFSFQKMNEITNLYRLNEVSILLEREAILTILCRYDRILFLVAAT